MSRIVVLPGDGVGPEVTAAAVRVLRAVLPDVQIERARIGGTAVEEEGTPLADATLALCQGADAVLLGAVGGPRWDHLRGERRCEAGLLKLRRGLGVFANLRPVRTHPALAGRSAVRDEVVRGTDLVVVRELTGGIYFSTPKGRDGDDAAVDTMRYTRAEIERVARVAFELARSRRGQLLSVDKANVLETSRLWRDTVTALAPEYTSVRVEHQLVDSCAMRLITSPRDFDVILTENLFGDILSDEAAVLAGSLGMLPSASLGSGGPGLYEPVHGSAPEIAGRGTANPAGAMLSVALMLRWSLEQPHMAVAIEAAVDAAIDAGVCTPDIGGTAGTEQVTQAVLDRLGAAVGGVTG